MNINGINSFDNVSLLKDLAKSKEVKKDGGFKEFLNNAISKVDDLQKEADNSNTLFAAGQVDNLHQVMIDSSKADISLQLTVQIRNKIMDAYSEIMRMQL